MPVLGLVRNRLVFCLEKAGSKPGLVLEGDGFIFGCDAGMNLKTPLFSCLDAEGKPRTEPRGQTRYSWIIMQNATE